MKKLVILALAALASHVTHAAIQFGNPTPEGVKAGKNPELFLVIWDQSNKISYVKDLGLTAYTDNYAQGQTSSNLFIYGTQDTGYQKIFDPLNSDPAFQTFLATSTDVTKQTWAVLGASSDTENLPISANGSSLYITARHSAPTGTLDGDYTNMLKWQQAELAKAVGSLKSNIDDINNTCSGKDCQTNYSQHLSGTYTKTANPNQYADATFSAAGLLLGSTQGPSLFNPVNQSSWFYALGLSSDTTDVPITVREFDNLKHDAYWGLGVDSKGNYILSYTLEAALTKPTTFAGGVLRLKTDYAASYGNTRLIAAPAGDAARIDLSGFNTTVTAVPEPATWGLMGLGLALLAGRARRRG